MRAQALARGLVGLAGWSLLACGADYESARTTATEDGGVESGESGEAKGEAPRLAKEDTDQVLHTLVIPFGPSDEGFRLGGDDGVVHWVVDMEEKEVIEGAVAPLKYLKVKGDLSVPKDAQNKPYSVGCLYVELKDNVYYREKTWLRMATVSGIHGKTYTEVEVPLSVELGGAWQGVPALEESLTLQEFAGNTLKKFDGTLCFKLDFTNAPAQDYKGELVVQYLRPGKTQNPPDCSVDRTQEGCEPGDEDDGGGVTPPAPFACAAGPVLLKAKQSADLAWGGLTGQGLSLTLAADDPKYKGSLGTLTATGAATARYTAPDKVPANVRIVATARPLGQEALPSFCEIKLQADDEICVEDDGETEGLSGNVYQLPANTPKLPDFDKLSPVAQVLVNNVDIPERSFSAGFPGVKDLVEWFGIRFRGQLVVKEDTTCDFKVTSDDGAILYLDGAKVVDNDGTHYTASKTGSKALTKGHHDFKLDYFQGPRYHITLQLFWKCGAAKDFQLVPASAFTRPLH
jgi:hypothetical protein